MINKSEDISFVERKTVFNRETIVFTTTLTVTDIGEFHGHARSKPESIDICNKQFFEFACQLSQIVSTFMSRKSACIAIHFSTLYNSNQNFQFTDKQNSILPVKIIRDLQSQYPKLLSITMLKFPTDDQNLCVVQLERMRSFARVAPTQEDAFKMVADLAADYLTRLAEGICGEN